MKIHSKFMTNAFFSHFTINKAKSVLTINKTEKQSKKALVTLIIYQFAVLNTKKIFNAAQFGNLRATRYIIPMYGTYILKAKKLTE